MQRWLFKTEPDEFSIADLAAMPGQSVRWDGIRNYQARNLIRDRIAPGDPVFIYHSSCKIPGIAGFAEVVSAPYPDPAQFDPDSPWFDPNSDPENPRWFCVDVRLQQQFEQLLPGKSLKTHPALQEMALFRQPRLSVQPVTEEEWEVILGLTQKHWVGRRTSESLPRE